MKKILSLTLAVLMITLCTACGKSAFGSIADTGVNNFASDDYSYSSSSSVAYDDAMEEVEYEAEEGVSIKGNGGAVTTNTSKPAESTDTSSVSEKIIYRFNMDIETLEYDKTISDLESLITKYGGFIETSESYGKSIKSSGKTRRNSYIVAKIPTASKNSFAEDLKGVGNITRESKSAQNVTREYYDLESRIESLKVQQERLLAILAKATSVEEILQVENELSNVRYKLESYTTDIKQLEHLTVYSTYTLNISEVVEYTEEPVYNPTFFERMLEDVADSFDSFLDFIEGALTVVIFIFPYLVVGGGISILVVYIEKRRKNRKKSKQDKNNKSEKAE